MTLAELQKQMAAAVMTPLDEDQGVARTNTAGEPVEAIAEGLFRTTENLAAVERLEIYSRSYWFRLIDSLAEDFPGLRRVLGSEAFGRMAVGYLRDCPSRSFTLRDLGSGLEKWLGAHPGFAGADLQAALDMTRLEWAHIVAFDGLAEKVLGPEDLLELSAELRVGLQPYIGLLQLERAVDALRVAVNADEDGPQEASNARFESEQPREEAAASLPPERIFLAVHRVESSVYYRRLEAEEFRLLRALRAGRTVGRAIEIAFRSSRRAPEDVPGLLEEWFRLWTEFGWLTRVRKGRRA